MSEIREHVAYLSQTIGPRPAGTEEEQQAALYITEQLQGGAQLHTSVEEFHCSPDHDIPKALCIGLVLLITIVAMIVPMMAIPSFIIALIASALYIAEAFDRPVLSRFFNKGISQNVVAKYEPDVAPGSQSARPRKVVLVAHYDSDKVQRGARGKALGLLPKLKWVSLGALALIPLILLLRCVVSFGGVGLIIVNVITVIAIVCAALPLVGIISDRTAAYTEGANNNAAGIAVLLDVASRVSQASGARVSGDYAWGAAQGDREDSEDDRFDTRVVFRGEGADESGLDEGGLSGEEGTGPVMHGRDAALASGLVPQGAEFAYDAAASMRDMDPDSPAARLLAAKEAVAVLTGRSVSPTISIDLSSGLENMAGSIDRAGESLGRDGEVASTAARGDELTAAASDSHDAGISAGASDDNPDSPGAPQQDGGASSSVATSQADESESEEKSLPDWFVKARQQARKPEDENPPVQRSRYADSLDEAISGSRAHFHEANQVVLSEAEKAMRKPGDIAEVRAPGFEDDAQRVKPMPAAQPATTAQPTPSAQPAAAAHPAAPVAQEASSGTAAASSPNRGESSRREANAVPAAPSTPVGLSAATGQLPRMGDDLVPVAAGAAGGAPAVAGKSGKSSGGVAGAQNQTSATVRTLQLGGAGSSDAGDRDPGATTAFTPPVINRAELAAEAKQVGSVQQDAPAPQKRRKLALPNIDAVIPGRAEEGAPQSATQPAGQSATQSATQPAGQLEVPNLPSVPAVDKPAPRRRSLRSTLPSVEATGAFAAIINDKRGGVTAGGAIPNVPNIGPQEYGGYPNPSVGAEGEGYDAYGGEYDAGYDAGYESGYDAAGGYDYEGEYGYGYETGYGPDGEGYDIDAQSGEGAPFAEGDPDYDPDYDPAYDPSSYVEMPKSRTRGFMDRLRRGKKQQQESSTQEWLDVDEDFDAYSAGSALGGWGNPRQDDLPADQYSPASGGGSRFRSSLRGRGGRSWNGGAFSRDQMERIPLPSQVELNSFSGTDTASDRLDDWDYEDRAAWAAEVEHEAEQVHRFHNPALDVEVWFVALGSELAANGGMRAFIDEHAKDLKGAFFIELDALGAGELSLVRKEGRYIKQEASSRMKRYARKAASALGMRLEEKDLLWKDTTSSLLMRRGYQAMHLACFLDGKPAFCRQLDDTVDNIDEETLQLSSDFVMEVVRGI